MSYDGLMEIVPDSRLTRRPDERKTWIYPWAEWTDGQTRVARQDVDFITPLEVFRNNLYAAAFRRGLTVVTKLDRSAKTVTFRFESKDPDQEDQ